MCINSVCLLQQATNFMGANLIRRIACPFEMHKIKRVSSSFISEGAVYATCLSSLNLREFLTSEWYAVLVSGVVDFA